MKKLSVVTALLASFAAHAAVERSSAIRAGVSSPNIHVAISQCGKLLVSTNQKTWRQVVPEMRTFFRDVTFANGQFVAVGGSYVGLQGVIMTSTDGEDWTIRRCGGKIILHGVTHGNGQFVVVGDEGVILTSKDGVVWKSRPRVSGLTLASVAYGAGQFVAVGDDGVALASSDSRRWTRIATGTSAYLASVKYENAQFVADGAQGSLQPGDALAWTLADTRTNRVKLDWSLEPGRNRNP